jgi:DNA-binding NarL/FixJ family response regulator
MADQCGTLLVENDHRMAVTLQAILVRQHCGPVEVVETAADARISLQRSVPDLVLIDLNLSEGNRGELIQSLRRAAFRGPILALTSAVGEQDIMRVLRCGADGYLFKEELAARLPTALEELRTGGVPLSPGAARLLLRELRSDRKELALPAITPRETSVLDLLATGGGYAEIARELKIELNTVRTHVRSLYEKLGVENRAEAVNIAWNLGLLQRSA